MQNQDKAKAIVKEKYATIALQSKDSNATSCCGATGCSTSEVYNIMADDYTHLEGYNEQADLGLGCGLPTEFAQIKPGDTVIDLGSGAGNDCFIARRITGETGTVIGIDFTEAMLDLARKNAEKAGFTNVQFRQGDIDDMPVTSNFADVVVSNCVLNLVPNKHKVVSEIMRVLKPGGHFSISDIVMEGQLPESWKQVAELYAGCITGAIQKDAYLNMIHEAGFQNITIQKHKPILIPDDILAAYLPTEEIEAFKHADAKISSITVYAEKPKASTVCTPGGGCC